MSTEPLPVTRIANIKPVPITRRWLVEGLWAEEAVGCIGGAPKSCKTWLSLELALSVATGKPCLGVYPVRSTGPVLLYAAEDSAANVRDRVAGLAKARDVALDKLAVGLITLDGLRLDVPEHRVRLGATLAHVKPRLLVLDPLVRLHHGDENSSAEVSELLGFLRGMQREHHVAIALVHHVRKSGASQPGQSLRGSGDLHAWGDSNLYLLRQQGKLVLHAEHRSCPAPPPAVLALTGEPPRLTVDGSATSSADDGLDKRILALLAAEPMTRTQLRDRLQVRNETLGEVLGRLEADRRLVRVDGRLTVPVPHLRDQRERNDRTA